MDGIINYLNQIDTNIFLYFNGLHNHYWDYFMGLIIADMMYHSFFSFMREIYSRCFPERFICFL